MIHPTKEVSIAVIGAGGVGSVFLQQLAYVASRRRSPEIRLVYVATIDKALYHADYQHIEIATALSALEAKGGPLPSISQTVEYLSRAPGKAIVVDNTSSQQIAEAYPQFLRHGFSVVTPNKKGFSGSWSLWQEIFDAEGTDGSMVYHECSVGAALPIIGPLKRLVETGDEITRVEGVFSGTMSYLFNNFAPTQGSGGKWSDEVKKAKELGYTEPDPRDDLNGLDVARKVTIVARLAGLAIESPTSFPVQSLIPKELEGVTSGEEFLQRLSEFDSQMEEHKATAAKDGKVVRFVGHVDVASKQAKVGLESFEKSHPIASLKGSDNIISIYTKRYGELPLIVQGAGAGAAVTAMGVLGDVLKVLERIRPPGDSLKFSVFGMDDWITRKISHVIVSITHIKRLKCSRSMRISPQSLLEIDPLCQPRAVRRNRAGYAVYLYELGARPWLDIRAQVAQMIIEQEIRGDIINTTQYAPLFDNISTMGTNLTRGETDKFVLTAEALHKALPKFHFSTQAVHADDFVSPHRAIAPAMHPAVNYRYTRDPDQLVEMENDDPNAPFDSHVYSRYTAPNSNRFEIVLKTLFGYSTVSYASGLAAFNSMLILVNPKKIFITDGYHGVHGIIDIMHKLNGLQKLSLDDIDQAGPGDMIHVETPLNPTGEARNLAFFKEKARAAGAILTVDATLAPPPLQDPIQLGADLVMHSGTKYIGGHSDMLCGIVVIHPDRVQEGWEKTLREERQVLGNVMGSLEGWLGIRSLRTLFLRVTQQSRNVQGVVAWLHKGLEDRNSVIGRTITKVTHSSIQKDALDEGWLQKQMPGGHGSLFSIWLKDREFAKRLPSKLYIFQHAASLGGVESLCEWRAMSSEDEDPLLLRFSLGVEDLEDLKADLLQGLEALLAEDS
ncbi:pyridoxal phosphate-dependent transferase [Fusarium redolens]|uniref:Homoserine dehydrogenase n=3 Tax=Fusarium TaxID=5506 RepID=A0A9P9FX20_FUSRE|nr:pyridoxal phosphate-dependent transferase [Fusarium redolens]KAH7205419.1 pyridoxal phosphate-dependent transferase [Fusarium redolens]